MNRASHPRTAPTMLAGKRLSRLVLTGFMGAGKSTVGKHLARITGWRFFDLDDCIEAECSRTVAEIFRAHGEAFFRTKEQEHLERLGKEDLAVIALGGGAIENPAVLDSLLQWERTCVVFLDAPLPELLGRISDAAQTRPLLTTLQELTARHRRRLPHYRAAHLTVPTTGLTPQEVADQVLKKVRKNWRIEQRGTRRDGEPAGR